MVKAGLCHFPFNYGEYVDNMECLQSPNGYKWCPTYIDENNDYTGSWVSCRAEHCSGTISLASTLITNQEGSTLNYSFLILEGGTFPATRPTTARQETTDDGSGTTGIPAMFLTFIAQTTLQSISSSPIKNGIEICILKVPLAFPPP